MRVLQPVLVGADGATLSEMECKAVDFGRKAAELALSCMLEGQRDEPVVVKCRCGGIARAKDARTRVQVTLAGTHSVHRMRYQCDCGEWLHPRDKHLGIGSSNCSSGVVALASEAAAGFPFGPCEEFLSRRFGHYFSTEANRTLYARFRGCGYYIGSGSVESACKQYGHGRLKQAKTRWKADGIEAVAHLHSALLNGRAGTMLEAARIAA